MQHENVQLTRGRPAVGPPRAAAVGRLHAFAIPAALVVEGAGTAEALSLSFSQATGIVSGAATAAAAGITAWLVIRSRSRAAAEDRALAAIAEHNPPIDLARSDAPAWLLDFKRHADTVAALTPAQLDVLAALYEDGWTARHSTASQWAFRAAHAAHRLSYAQQSIAEMLIASPAAANAGWALLVRDVIPVDDFAALTDMWVTAGLPLPGGDISTQYTAVIERHITGDQWQEKGRETITATSGESPQQLAAALIQVLAADLVKALASRPGQPDGSWRLRLRLWNGVDADTTTEPDGEAFHRITLDRSRS